MGIQCLGREVENPQKHKKMGEFNEYFMDMVRFLQGNRFQVEVIWGCQISNLQQNDPQCKEHENEIVRSVVAPLEPRDAFFSGITNAC